MKFSELNIMPEIIKALAEQNITEPTMVQEKSIPVIKQGKDIIGISKTGSGKTLAFGIPLLEKIRKGQGLQAIVLAPTRELAVQIANELKKYSKDLGLRIATVYGGVGYNPQIEALAKSEIAVATTGRLLDHMRQNNFDLKRIHTVILDEADKMVDMGFIEDIDQILSQAPKDRQILLFGATIGDEINRLKSKYMREYVTIKAETHVKDDFLEQYYYNVKQHEKFSLLMHLLEKEDTDRVIVFCSARKTVDAVARNLRKQGIKAEMIHGKLTQKKREIVIEKFKKGTKVLVASAVAARGLDINGVSHVINYDLSQDPEEYIHRVGRTARAGESGKAITLLSDRDHEAFSHILNRFPIDVKLLPKEDFKKMPFDMGQSRRDFRQHGRQGSGRRKGFSRSQRSAHRSGYSDNGYNYEHQESSGRNNKPSWNNPAVRSV